MQKKISYGGLGCALCVILLAMSSYLPTMKAATLFLASTLSYVLCFVIGVKWTFVMYASSSVLAFLICQGASPAIVWSYIICFGNFPILKTALDRKPQVVNYVAKFLLYTVYFLAVYFVFARLLNLPLIYSAIILYAVGAVVFVFYDFLLLNTGRYLINLLNK